jgi:hypothetical protein
VVRPRRPDVPFIPPIIIRYINHYSKILKCGAFPSSLALFVNECRYEVKNDHGVQGIIKRRNFMKKRQRVGKIVSVKKMQDVDRGFAVMPEVAPDQWRENLDVFFDENEAGLDHVRHLTDISKADIDHYYFTGGYDLTQVKMKRTDAGPRPRASLALITRLGDAIPVYENAGCFRYAMP